MRILNINATEVGKKDFALPFETDEQVRAAWGHLIRNRLVSIRPEPDVDNQDRAYLELIVAEYRNGGELKVPGAAQIRRLVSSIYQAELNFDIRELIGVSAS